MNKTKHSAVSMKSLRSAVAMIFFSSDVCDLNGQIWEVGCPFFCSQFLGFVKLKMPKKHPET